jgi:hypothetical protein
MFAAKKELNRQMELDGGNVPDMPTDPGIAINVICKYKSFIQKALEFIAMFCGAKGKEAIRRISLALDQLCDD